MDVNQTFDCHFYGRVTTIDESIEPGIRIIHSSFPIFHRLSGAHIDTILNMLPNNETDFFF